MRVNKLKVGHAMGMNSSLFEGTVEDHHYHRADRAILLDDGNSGGIRRGGAKSFALTS